MRAPKHPKEEDRLNALRFYEVLDTEAEADFDDIVSLASKICDVPVSLISLVDEDRQWFKAKVGFEPPETTLLESVCAHAILSDELTEIPDLAEDERTRDNPLHIGKPYVRFYAGANLFTPEGLPIGTICVLDSEPRQLTDLQREALRTLSRQVVIQLELRKKIRQETALRSEIDHRVANSLQTLSTLMRMSARHVSDPEALEVLTAMEGRLSAVASLHTELMRGDGRAVVEAPAYLKRVADFMRQVCPPNIDIRVDAAEVEIRSSAASALGMIASEFVANSSKHAFPDARDGQITLRLRPLEDGGLEFLCADNGVGRAAEHGESFGVSSGLGAGLVAAAASQVDGTLAHEIGDEGTQLSLLFRQAD